MARLKVYVRRLPRAEDSSKDASQTKSTGGLLFNRCIEPLVERCASGHGCAVIACGASSSGKSFTLGCSTVQQLQACNDSTGFLGRSVVRLFECVGSRACASAVSLSAAEVQGDDQMIDLLATSELQTTSRDAQNTACIAANAPQAMVLSPSVIPSTTPVRPRVSIFQRLPSARTTAGAAPASSVQTLPQLVRKPASSPAQALAILQTAIAQHFAKRANESGSMVAVHRVFQLHCQVPMRPASAPPLRGAGRAPAARAQPSMRSSTLTIVELASANPLLPQRELDRVLRGQRVMGRLLAATLQGDPGVLLTRDSKLTRLLAGCLGEVALLACMHGEGDEGAAAAAASGDDVTYRFLQQLQPGGSTRETKPVNVPRRPQTGTWNNSYTPSSSPSPAAAAALRFHQDGQMQTSASPSTQGSGSRAHSPSPYNRFSGLVPVLGTPVRKGGITPLVTTYLDNIPCTPSLSGFKTAATHSSVQSPTSNASISAGAGSQSRQHLRPAPTGGVVPLIPPRVPPLNLGAILEDDTAMWRAARRAGGTSDSPAVPGASYLPVWAAANHSGGGAVVTGSSPSRTLAPPPPSSVSRATPRSGKPEIARLAALSPRSASSTSVPVAVARGGTAGANQLQQHPVRGRPVTRGIVSHELDQPLNRTNLNTPGRQLMQDQGVDVQQRRLAGTGTVGSTKPSTQPLTARARTPASTTAQEGNTRGRVRSQSALPISRALRTSGEEGTLHGPNHAVLQGQYNTLVHTFQTFMAASAVRTPRTNQTRASPNSGPALSPFMTDPPSTALDPQPTSPRNPRSPACPTAVKSLSSSSIAEIPSDCVSSSSEAVASRWHVARSSGNKTTVRASKTRSSGQSPSLHAEHSKCSEVVTAHFPTWPLSLVCSQEEMFGTGMEEGTLLAPPGLPFFNYDNFSSVPQEGVSALSASCDWGLNSPKRSTFAVIAPDEIAAVSVQLPMDGPLPSSSRICLIPATTAAQDGANASANGGGGSGGCGGDTLGVQMSHFCVLQDGLYACPTPSDQLGLETADTSEAGDENLSSGLGPQGLDSSQVNAESLPAAETCVESLYAERRVDCETPVSTALVRGDSECGPGLPELLLCEEPRSLFASEQPPSPMGYHPHGSSQQADLSDSRNKRQAEQSLTDMGPGSRRGTQDVCQTLQATIPAASDLPPLSEPRSSTFSAVSSRRDTRNGVSPVGSPVQSRRTTRQHAAAAAAAAAASAAPPSPGRICSVFEVEACLKAAGNMKHQGSGESPELGNPDATSLLGENSVSGGTKGLRTVVYSHHRVDQGALEVRERIRRVPSERELQQQSRRRLQLEPQLSTDHHVPDSERLTERLELDQQLLQHPQQQQQQLLCLDDDADVVLDWSVSSSCELGRRASLQEAPSYTSQLLPASRHPRLSRNSLSGADLEDAATLGTKHLSLRTGEGSVKVLGQQLLHDLSFSCGDVAQQQQQQLELSQQQQQLQQQPEVAEREEDGRVDLVRDLRRLDGTGSSTHALECREPARLQGGGAVGLSSMAASSLAAYSAVQGPSTESGQHQASPPVGQQHKGVVKWMRALFGKKSVLQGQ